MLSKTETNLTVTFEGSYGIVTINGHSGNKLLYNEEIAVLLAAKLKANDGLRPSDLPRRFRGYMRGLAEYNLIKLRTETKKPQSLNARFVLTNDGKEIIRQFVEHKQAQGSERFVPIVAFSGKVSRHVFYKLFYFVMDTYQLKHSREFGALDRLALKRLYNQTQKQEK